MPRNSLLVSILLICNASAADDGGCIERESTVTENPEEAAKTFWQVEREPALTLDDVRRIIDEFECFQPMPDRAGTNPFTNESMLFPGEGRAIYIEGSEAIGNLALDEGRILFTGVPEAIVQDVAELVSGTILPWDSS